MSVASRRILRLPTTMHSVFISYRRSDSGGHAGRLYDRLVQALGREHVFMDIDSISYGEDFIEAISRTLAECEIVLVLIGPTWCNIRDANGARRLDSLSDTVRLEVSKALELGRKVIPVLVGGAAMPDTESLPSSLLPLSRRNAIDISDRRFNADARELVKTLAELLRAPNPQSISRQLEPEVSVGQRSERSKPAVRDTSTFPTGTLSKARYWRPVALVSAAAAMLGLAGVFVWLLPSAKDAFWPPKVAEPDRDTSRPSPPMPLSESARTLPKSTEPNRDLSPTRTTIELPRQSETSAAGPMKAEQPEPTRIGSASSSPISAPAPTLQDLIQQIKLSTSRSDKASLKLTARSLVAPRLNFGTVSLSDAGTHTTLTFKSYDPATNVVLMSESVKIGPNVNPSCSRSEGCTYKGDLKVDLGRVDRLKTYTDTGGFELGCWGSYPSTKCITPLPTASSCSITRCADSEAHANSIFEPPSKSGMGPMSAFKRAAGTIVYEIDGRPAK